MVTAAAAPAGAAAPVQYGPRLSAIGVYLWHGQFLSRNRACQAMAELFGVPVSPGAVSWMVTRITAVLDPALEAIRSAVTGAEVAHFDETGFRVAGKLAWVHCASAGNYALITVHPKRGTQGIDAAGVFPEFSGSPSMTRGHHATPTPAWPGTPCATPTRCGSFRLSPTRPRPGSGAGPGRPLTRCAR
jgi:transposase